VAGANFRGSTRKGFTKEQLYSTASYQAHDLHNIELSYNDLTGWNLAGQNLTSAGIAYSTLTNADLSGANLTEATFLNTTLTGADLRRADARRANAYQLDTAITDNLIRPDGHVQGLNLLSADIMPIRDYGGGIAITIDDAMTLAEGSILDIIFADAAWGSTITLAGGFTPDLGGTLRLGFAPGTDPLALVGTTFDVFNWNGLLASGDQFSQVLSLPGYQWDLANLYTTGEVTFTAVPEPATVGLMLLAGVIVVRPRRMGKRVR